MAKDAIWANALIGGGTGALDKVDGATLEDLELAFVATATMLHPFSLDEDDGGSESSPDKIQPDTNAGTKMWELLGLTIKDLTLRSVVDAGADVDKFLVLDASNNVDYRTGAEVLADISGDAAAAFDFNSQNLTGVGTIVFEDATAYLLQVLTYNIGVYWDTSIGQNTLVLRGYDKVALGCQGTNVLISTPAAMSLIPASVNISAHNGSTEGLKLGGTLVDALATDINLIKKSGRAQGDILYASATNILAWLPKGTDNQILKMNGNVPNWEAEAGGGLSNIVEDTTPQLGGDLDINGHHLDFAANEQIKFLSGNAYIMDNGTQLIIHLGATSALKIMTGATIGEELLHLYHTDADQAFINFDGTSGSGSNIEPTEKNIFYRMIMIEILGTKKYLKVYDA